MPRIFSSLYTPYTYAEFMEPIKESTEAHKKIEDEYNANMLIVDSLRQRAQNELQENPESKWASDIINYADKLEQYSDQLAKNGLGMGVKDNLMDMRKMQGTTLTPVLNAISREKEFQSVRDKAVGTNMVFGKMPSIDEIIANPNIGQTAYNWDDIYAKSSKLAEAMSKRNIEVFSPQHYNEYYDWYGKKKGFSNDEISVMMANDPGFRKLFSEIIKSSGFDSDTTLSNEQKNSLYNAVVAGALTGFTYDIDVNYNHRPDYIKPKAEEDKKEKTSYYQFSRSLDKVEANAKKDDLVNGYIRAIEDLQAGLETGEYKDEDIQKMLKGKSWIQKEFEAQINDRYAPMMDPLTQYSYRLIKAATRAKDTEQTIKDIADKYNVELNRENLDILKDLVRIDLSDSVMKTKYFASNDNVTRSEQIQKGFYNTFSQFKDGNTHLMDAEKHKPYKADPNDWLRKNGNGSFSIIYDPSDEKNPLIINTNGKQLVPDSDFFADRKIVELIKIGSELSNTAQREYSRTHDSLKATLKDLSKNPDKYIEAWADGMTFTEMMSPEFVNNIKSYSTDSSVINGDKVIVQGKSIDKRQLTNILRQKFVETVYDYLYNEGSEIGSINEAILCNQKELFKTIQEMFGVQMPGDQSTDKTVYDNITGR